MFNHITSTLLGTVKTNLKKPFCKPDSPHVKDHISYFLVEVSRFHRSYCYMRTFTKGEASWRKAPGKVTFPLNCFYMWSLHALHVPVSLHSGYYCFLPQSHKSILKGFHSTLSAVLIIRDVSWVMCRDVKPNTSYTLTQAAQPGLIRCWVRLNGISMARSSSATAILRPFQLPQYCVLYFCQSLAVGDPLQTFVVVRTSLQPWKRAWSAFLMMCVGDGWVSVSASVLSTWLCFQQ